MCSDIGEASHCCAFYSAFGFMFTLWVGIMIHTQPFFISGIEDMAEARASAWGATGCFLVTFLASMGGLYYEANYKKEPVDDEEAEYHLQSDNIPTYGTSS